MASDDSISIRESPCWPEHGLVGFGRKEPEDVLTKTAMRARDQEQCGSGGSEVSPEAEESA